MQHVYFKVQDDRRYLYSHSEVELLVEQRVIKASWRADHAGQKVSRKLRTLYLSSLSHPHPTATACASFILQPSHNVNYDHLSSWIMYCSYTWKEVSMLVQSQGGSTGEVVCAYSMVASSLPI